MADIISLGVVYVTRVSAMLSDTIVVVVTWRKTYAQWRHGKRLNVSTNLSTLLLRDGKPFSECH